MASRFGRQPARAVLLMEGRSISATARVLNLPRTHVRDALLGVSPPSPGLRAGLPQLLRLPVEKLFTTEALAAAYDPARGPGAGQRRTQAWAAATPSTRLWSAAVAAAASDPVDPITDEALISHLVALMTAASGARHQSTETENAASRLETGRAS